VQVSEPIRPDRLTGVTLTQSATPVAVSTTLDSTSQVLTITPAVPLGPSVSYTLAVTGLQDMLGNSQVGTYTATFTTATGADLNGPSIVSYSPASGETGVGVNATVQVQFSKPLNPISVNSNSLLLFRRIDSYPVPVNFAITPYRTTVTLTPQSPLQNNTQYTMYVAYYTYPTDVAGNNSASGSFSFTTGAGTVSSETITQIIPPNGATNVPVNVQILAVASSPVDPLTVKSTNFTVKCGGNTLPGSVSLAPDQVTFTFTPSPQSCTGTYNVQISGFSDVNGNLVTPFTSSYTTSSSTPVISGPSLASITPPAMATGIPINTTVTASFSGSSQIDPLTINLNDFEVSDYATGANYAGTYTVTPIGNPATGSLITFTPAENFKPNSKVGVYVYGPYMRDFAGNQAQGYINTYFNTANTPDSVTPQVIAISPASGTQNVGQNAVITLTFNKSLLPSTVTGSGYNIALFNGSTRISASVSLSSDNRSAVLNASNLPLGATLTVVASTDITDISGNHLAPFSSSFTVTSEANVDRPTIVSQRPVTGASLVPTNASITLFSSNPLNVASVNGALHVSQNGVAVPGTISTVASGQAIAFTPNTPFAAGSLIQVFLDQTAVDVYGNTLGSTYSSHFNVAPDPTVTGPSPVASSPGSGTQNVAINTSVIQVAFNEALNPATVNTSTVTLYNSIQGWLSGYTVSLDSTGTIVTVHPPAGNLVANAYYQVSTSSAIQNTSGLAAAGGSSFTFYTDSGTDSTTPVVTSVIPTDTSTGIGVNARAVVSFNKGISYFNSGMQLLQAGHVVPAEFTSVDAGYREFTITPFAPLTPNTTYTISITGAQDWEGNTAPSKTTSFTTGSGADLTPPVPVANNFGGCYSCGVVPTNVVLYWRFNKPIARSSVSSNTVYLTNSNAAGTPALPATLSVSTDGMTVMLQPSSPLTANYSYYWATITGVSDIDGNVLNPSLNSGSIDLNGNCQNYCNFYFSTGSGPDNTPPVVQTVTPANNFTNVPLNAVIEAQLSKPLALGSFDTVTLSVGGTPMPVTVTYGSTPQTILITPGALLTGNATYTVSLAGVTDMVGNAISCPCTWSFATGNTSSLTPPGQPAFTPTGVGVSRSTAATIVYNKPINVLSVNPESYVQLYWSGGVVPATYTYSADLTTITITPKAPLQANTNYTIYAYYVQDLAGNQSSSYSSSFTTGP
jgi:hypothetical protein